MGDSVAWSVTLEIERAGERSTTTFQTKQVADDHHTLSIGSSPLADVVIPHHAVAKTHCWLIVNDAAFTWLREARTTPGTRVDGLVIEDTVRLPVGARIQIGDAAIVLVRKPEPANPSWRLALRVGYRRGPESEVRVFYKSEVIVGSGSDCDLQIANANASRHHCAFTVDHEGNVRVRDLGSTNGLWVNGARAHPDVPLRVDLDRVFVGDHVVMLAERPYRVPR